jgi:hypothetical protein
MGGEGDFTKALGRLCRFEARSSKLTRSNSRKILFRGETILGSILVQVAIMFLFISMATLKSLSMVEFSLPSHRLLVFVLSLGKTGRFSGSSHGISIRSVGRLLLLFTTTLRRAQQTWELGFMTKVISCPRYFRGVCCFQQ